MEVHDSGRVANTSAQAAPPSHSYFRRVRTDTPGARAADSVSKTAQAASPQVPKSTAFSMPLQSDQLSAPTESTTGGIRYLAQRPIEPARGPTARRNPNVATLATSAAHIIKDALEKPSQ